MSARDVIAAEFGRMHQSVCYPTASDGEKEWAGDSILSALTAAGHRIVPPGGLDAVSVERCAQIADSVDSGCEDPWDHAAQAIAAALRSLIEEPTNDAR